MVTIKRYPSIPSAVFERLMDVSKWLSLDGLFVHSVLIHEQLGTVFGSLELVKQDRTHNDICLFSHKCVYSLVVVCVWIMAHWVATNF